MGHLARFCALGLIFASIPSGRAQLAALFSDVGPTNDCKYWSPWGPCIWTQALQGTTRSRFNNLYLDQMSELCRDKHWFYQYIATNYGTALNNVFNYLKSVTTNPTPCGMCSYRQSCGFGGSKQCQRFPSSVHRNILPLFVTEQVCGANELGGRPQNMACNSNYATLLRNGAECQLWPSTIPVLTGVDEDFKQKLYSLPWANCIPNRERTECRCCCYPYRPNPLTFQCEQIPGVPPAPGAG